MLQLKVCGMKYPDNIEALEALQPNYMGFIFYKQSKRYIASLDPNYLKSLPQHIKATGVFVDESLEEVVNIARKFGLRAIQLHGMESPDFCKQIKSFLPSIEVIKAFGINESFKFETLIPYTQYVNYFLFDTQTAGHGGSGKIFNWQLLDQYNLDKPYFLSGGIGLEQLGQIIKIMDPRLYAIDVNSRFEINAGLKDIEQLKTFKNHLLGTAQ